MEHYLELSAEDRRLVCIQEEARGLLNAAAVEKDFWVCWTLRTLFGMNASGSLLTFKGGTSLSKGFGIIERFSEDIDVVVDRAALGFTGAQAPEAAISGKKRKERAEAIVIACREYVRDTIFPVLTERVAETKRDDEQWSISWDTEDRDGTTLLLAYPSVFVYEAALKPVVRIEMGARSDIDPAVSCSIIPYVGNVLQGIRPFTVRTLAPQRTFWEKVMLLHEQTYDVGGNVQVRRMSRHYYDIWCLWNEGSGKIAIKDVALFEQTRAHRRLYFQRKAAAQAAIQKGSLKLLPDSDDEKDWVADYAAMRDMFFSNPPPFDTLLDTAREIQETFNSQVP